MPYISPEKRVGLDEFLADVPRNLTAGEVNYLITDILLTHLGNRFGGPRPRYDDYNEAIGVLECVKLELYRRAVAPFEDIKREENGDVYPDTE